MPTDDEANYDRNGRRVRITVLVCGVVVVAAFLVFFVVRRGQVNTPVRRAIEVAPQEVAESVEEPAEERWETEEFAEAASAQLGQLGHILSSKDDITEAMLSGVVASEFAGVRLRPDSLETVYDSVPLQVRRWNKTEEKADQTNGVDGFVEQLLTLREPFRDALEIHIKFKIYSVDVGEESVVTKVIYQASGRHAQGAIQQSAKWLCRWHQSAPQAQPRLAHISLESFEEVVGDSPTGTLFADCTQAVFRNEPSFENQILPGIDFWRSAIQAQYAAFPYGHHGIAVGDINGDGLDDVYACQPAGLPNRMYIQNLDGTVRDMAQAGGVDWLDRSRGALLIDIDDDGDQDLAVVVNDMIQLMENDGSGHFAERLAHRPTDNAAQLAAADYVLDGDLDLYVVSYGKRFLADGESSGPIPYHDANNGGPNMLLRNDGDWNFTDATQESGLDMNNRRWSFAASWEDYDADGDLDLYVANDYGRNNLYRNDDGSFVDVAAAAGVEDIACGMSVTWGDYDQDGKVDLYVGNMFSSAGLRITNQDQFHANKSEKMRADFRRHARGNSLFHNEGDGTFRDVSEEADVTIGRWAWGSNFVDINNDGLEDLVVANGFVTGTDTKDL